MLQHTGVAVLRRESRAQHFQAHGGEGVDEGGVVAEPPAAVHMKIGELAGCDCKLVLVVHAQNCGEELDVREHGAQAIQNAYVEGAHPVARLSQSGIRGAPCAAFYGKWKR